MAALPQPALMTGGLNSAPPTLAPPPSLPPPPRAALPPPIPRAMPPPPMNFPRAMPPPPGMFPGMLPPGRRLSLSLGSSSSSALPHLRSQFIFGVPFRAPFRSCVQISPGGSTRSWTSTSNFVGLTDPVTEQCDCRPDLVTIRNVNSLKQGILVKLLATVLVQCTPQ
jgi:hypothetical protein